MGASQSVISIDDFKNYLYGTAVLMVSPRLDGELQYKECAKITDDDKHVLPMVLEQQQPKDIDEVIKAYCSYYGNSGKEEAVDKYVTEHILDSEEHIHDFMKQLVSLLQERRNHVVSGIKRIAPAPSMRQATPVQAQSMRQAAPTPTSVPTPVPVPVPVQSQAQAQAQSQAQAQNQAPTSQAPTQSVRSALATHHIRGHGKLQRRMNNVNQSINNERAIFDARQQAQVQAQAQPSVPEHVHQPPEENAMKQLEALVNSAPLGENVDVYDEASTAETETDAGAGSGHQD